MRTFRALSLIVITMLAMVAGPSHSEAASAAEIDADVNAALTSFESQIVGARELASKAAGVLVFPSVVKAGLGLGGEYGEGLLIIRGRPSGYYNLISGSFGFQLGVHAAIRHTKQALTDGYLWAVELDIKDCYPSFDEEKLTSLLLPLPKEVTHYVILSLPTTLNPTDNDRFSCRVQTRTVIIMFMTEQALASFESIYGWKVGVDGSVAIVTLGAGGAIDTESLTSPVLGFSSIRQSDA
jgi:lipid-binding SYLF domain-containing protein